MQLPIDNTEALIGFGLFIASELIGMSKARDNSLLQLVLHMASELFPYELQRREPANRSNRPRLKRDSRGRYVSRRTDSEE
jgi:hypothetical protein